MDGKLSTLWPAGLAWLRRAGWFLSGMAVVGACLAYRAVAPADRALAKPPASKAQPSGKVQQATATEKAATPAPLSSPNAATAPKKNPVAALVNEEPITRDELARDCLTHYGDEVLESMVNRALILASCRKRNITVTDQEVADEIEHMAKRFSIGKEQWLKMLEKERGIKPARYAQDIVWPMIALRRLAKDKLKVTKKELEEAYESEFGPSVKVRLIALDNAQQAKKVHAEAVAKPDEFASLAKKYSKDVNGASSYGMIQPIRRHLGDPKLEEAAFALKKGEISPIVKVAEMYVFVKCDEQLPPPKGVDRAKVEPMLIEALKDRKLRAAAGDVFKELQKNSSVDLVYGNGEKTRQLPGVAAVIDEQKITMRELAEECMDRHGTEVLEGAIHRRLLEQALRKKNLKIGDADVDAEIAPGRDLDGKDEKERRAGHRGLA